MLFNITVSGEECEYAIVLCGSVRGKGEDLFWDLHTPMEQCWSFPFCLFWALLFFWFHSSLWMLQCPPQTTNYPAKYPHYCSPYFLIWHLSFSPVHFSLCSGRSLIMSLLSDLMALLVSLLGFFLALNSDVHPCPSLGSRGNVMFCLSSDRWAHSFCSVIFPSLTCVCALSSLFSLLSSYSSNNIFFVTHIH